MTEHSKLIAYIEQKVREAERIDLFRSWLNPTRDQWIDLYLWDAIHELKRQGKIRS